jgi:general L-amino acid transport system substrate-binding protein
VNGTEVMGFVVAVALFGTTGIAAAQGPSATLDTVKKRGTINCGVSTGVAGFSNPDDKGNWSGLDSDFCRAVALAVFNDSSKVSFKPLTAKERFTALQSGEIDLLSRTTTWTMGRDTALGLTFVGVMFYDGQGFMVKKSLGVKSTKELNGASICVQTGTTTELNLADFFRTNKMAYKTVVFERTDETIAAFDAGRCDAFTTDSSQLYADRLKLKNPAENIVLPEIISKEPLGPVVRQGDFQWFTTTKWVYFALLTAEELGVNSKNVDDMLNSANPDIKRLLGKEGDYGKGIGLDNAWAYNIVKKVGNYGEIYERNVGEGSPLKIARGLNKLWNEGGLQYAPPVR